MDRPFVERETVRLRNAAVSAVTGATVSLTLDGATVTGVAVYGPMPAVSAKVLVLEQGGSLLVLGDAVSRMAELEARVAALETGGA